MSEPGTLRLEGKPNLKPPLSRKIPQEVLDMFYGVFGERLKTEEAKRKFELTLRQLWKVIVDGRFDELMDPRQAQMKDKFTAIMSSSGDERITTFGDTGEMSHLFANASMYWNLRKEQLVKEQGPSVLFKWDPELTTEESNFLVENQAKITTSGYYLLRTYITKPERYKADYGHPYEFRDMERDYQAIDRGRLRAEIARLSGLQQ